MGRPADPNSDPFQQPGRPEGPAGWAPPQPQPPYQLYQGGPGPSGRPNAPIPADRPSPYAPSAAPAARPRRPWGAALLGLAAGLVIAVAVGAILIAAKAARFGTGTDQAPRVSDRSITLPASLGGFQDYLAVAKARIGKSSGSANTAAMLSSQQANQEKVSSQTIAAYQRANPGAAVAYRAYTDGDLSAQVAVIAVRAGYPGLTLGPVVDPAYLGLAAPPQQIKAFGGVECVVVQMQPAIAGRPIDPQHEAATMCQRTGEALTVQVYGGASVPGPSGQQQMVALTEAAWTAASA